MSLVTTSLIVTMAGCDCWKRYLIVELVYVEPQIITSPVLKLGAYFHTVLKLGYLLPQLALYC